MDGGGRRRRPNAGQWLWYCFGGGLPPRLSDWVLFDTTSLMFFGHGGENIQAAAIKTIFRMTSFSVRRSFFL